MKTYVFPEQRPELDYVQKGIEIDIEGTDKKVWSHAGQINYVGPNQKILNTWVERYGNLDNEDRPNPTDFIKEVDEATNHLNDPDLLRLLVFKIGFLVTLENSPELVDNRK